jgi:hypothetical protein
MSFRKIGDILIPFLSFCAILATSGAVIAYGRGYRLDVIQKSLNPTGLLAATSDPTGAQILVDGVLKSATNNTINVPPGWYRVSIAKEGYQTWEKNIGVRGEVVSRADAYLFPTNPSLSAITTTGVAFPSLSPDGSQLAYVIPQQQEATSDGVLLKRAGIWVLDLTDRPLGLNRDARQIAKTELVDFSQSILFWSPDSKQILATVTQPGTEIQSYYLLDADGLNDPPLRIYALQDLQDQWNVLSQVKDREKISGLPLGTRKTINEFMKIISFSPDENKILYEASVSGMLPQVIKPPLIGTNTTPEDRNILLDTIYVYDIKEDHNYRIGAKQDVLPTAETPKKTVPAPAEPLFSQPVQFPTLQWFPTNRHLIFVSKGKIEIMDYDALNRKTIYSGPFWDSFVVPWTNASKILILTTLNPLSGNLPNLYALNLR